MPNVEDSGKDPIIAVIAIDLPLWYGKYRAAEREARHRHEAALRKKTDRENNLLADLQLALFNVRDAHRQIDLYGDTLIPKAKQSLEVTQTGFEAGKVDFLNLIDAERLLLEFQLSYERALANHAQTLAQLEMLVGRSIPRAGGGEE
jgi:outer membrane protein TolC